MTAALEGVRVLDLSSGIAGPMAAMMLGDFGADVVKVEPPGGAPDRGRPGFVMWNRNKRSVVLDTGSDEGRARLAELLAGADVCVANGLDAAIVAAGAGPDAATAANPALVYLSMPPYLDEAPWEGGAESNGLLSASMGVAVRQSSFDGGPIDLVFPYLSYDQAIWGAASAGAALVERERSGHGQRVTVGGVHGTMIATTASLVIDPSQPERASNVGPGGPSVMYTRYLCGDGEWLFIAALTPKFQESALQALGLTELLDDERIHHDLEQFLLPANRPWVRKRFEEVFATKPREEWVEIFRVADCPAGRLFHREGWLDHPQTHFMDMRVELEDPERGHAVMPGNPVKLTATPPEVRTPAPRAGEHGSTVEWSPREAPSRTPAPSAGPLEGFRVLDLGTILAGPYAGTLLADLGAEVVKVEPPAGDVFRERGFVYNRGQRGVALDLRSPEGLAAFYKLVQWADVVLDNYRPGVLGRLKIDYEHLREVSPDVICTSISAFGEGGPFAEAPGFDPLLQAMSGMMYAQGGDSEPVLHTIAINDVGTAALAAFGTIVSLFHRVRSGQGQRAWVALAGTSSLVQAEELVEVAGRQPPTYGGRDFPGPGPLDRFYATSDGYLRLQADANEGLERLRKAGVLDGAPTGSSDELTAGLRDAFAERTTDDALAALAAVGIPATKARRGSELTEDSDLMRFEILHELTKDDGSTYLAPGRYALFSRTQRSDVLVPPGLGQHTREVLGEAGVQESELDTMEEGKLLFQGGPMVYRSFAAYR